MAPELTVSLTSFFEPSTSSAASIVPTRIISKDSWQKSCSIATSVILLLSPEEKKPLRIAEGERGDFTDQIERS